MLPGEAPPGRGAPGLGAPGRGAGGRGMGRSTGCADENGLLPTRGGRIPGLGIGPGAPGRAPGAMPGWGPGGLGGCAGVGAAGRGPGAGGAGVSVAATGGAGGGAVATPPASALAAVTASPLPTALSIAWSRALSSDLSTGLAGPRAALGARSGALAAAAGLLPPNDSRSRRATGASTVDDADLTNSPCSFSRARTSLLVTPSSLANSCTRALPATTSPVYEATVGRPRLGVSYDALSSGLHGVLMFFATCSVAGASSALTCSMTADVSAQPVILNALLKARRLIACCTHCDTGCSHAPRPGRLLAESTIRAYLPFPVDSATTRSSSTANSRFRHPTHVRTGPSVLRCAKTVGSRWITAKSSVTGPVVRIARTCPAHLASPSVGDMADSPSKFLHIPHVRQDQRLAGRQPQPSREFDARVGASSGDGGAGD